MPFVNDPGDSTYNNILRLIEEVGYTTQQIAAEKCEVTVSRSQYLLNKMVSRGQIERRGNNYVKLGYAEEVPETRMRTKEGRIYRIKDAILDLCDPGYYGYFSDKTENGRSVLLWQYSVQEIKEALSALLVADIIEKHGEHLYTLKGEPLPDSSKTFA